MASPVSSISSISSMSSSSSSEWYSSSSEEDVIMHNMIMNAAQVFMSAAEGSSQPLTRRAKYNRDQEGILIFFVCFKMYVFFVCFKMYVLISFIYFLF
ncbi:hypothetical protein HanHA300_Chr09g0329181 [Helianthus annuus]|nr:hypothetical protein HanHA300_Chr09g0329181 [Helianthus annuus]KAJ0708439.1 hypothetical protein HanLR1_Chr09g0329421 [Helianthus annuus]